MVKKFALGHSKQNVVNRMSDILASHFYNAHNLFRLTLNCVISYTDISVFGPASSVLERFKSCS